MKIDLPDVTFVIPFFLDSPHRARNLTICLNYLNKNLNTSICVAEQNGSEALQLMPENVEHIKVESKFQEIHKAALINEGIGRAVTPIVVSYDCDILLPPDQYEKAASLIRAEEYDMVYPYDGKFLTLSDELVREVKETLDIAEFESMRLSNACGATKSVGGARFYNRRRFIECGMENENFVGWAFHDNEAHHRLSRLGMKFSRTDKPLYHMNHVATGKKFNDPSNLANREEFKRIQKMHRLVLKDEVSKWPWRDRWLKLT